MRTVAWAASNGDRSENGDYIYGKRRLREIDRRIRYLTKRLDSAVVVDPAEREETDQIFFGATIVYAGADGAERTISIVGLDEVDPQRGRVSWISPIAKALLRKRAAISCVSQPPGVWRRSRFSMYATWLWSEVHVVRTQCLPLSDNVMAAAIARS